MSKYTIGTRGSLLAVTQCTLIKNEIEKQTGCSFELKKISTQGDQQTEKPLWQMDGKDFFTKELDEALLANDVDLVVHSYKDLGSERPENISLATITERKYANDILLIKNETIKNMQNISSFNVGTSSPRRIVNIESSLKEFLPNIGSNATVKCSMLRGNVNTRIKKLKDGHYDAIVLALAGLERLANKDDSKIELEDLLENTNFMILPQKEFPSSASQGALAIEINSKRENPQELIKILKSVHHLETEEEVKRERQAFNSYGGGCHLAVGIHVKKHKDLYIHMYKGEFEKKKIHSVFIENAMERPESIYNIIGKNDFLIQKTLLSPKLSDDSNYFVTSPHCFQPLKALEKSHLWTAGIKSWKSLAKLGHWVNGSAEGFGHEEILKLKDSNAIQIMLTHNKWQVLSHDMAQSPIGPVIPCYTRNLQTYDEKSTKELLLAENIYWNSFYQYTKYCEEFPAIKTKNHYCGLGKTYDLFLKEKIKITPIIIERKKDELGTTF